MFNVSFFSHSSGKPGLLPQARGRTSGVSPPGSSRHRVTGSGRKESTSASDSAVEQRCAGVNATDRQPRGNPDG